MRPSEPRSPAHLTPKAPMGIRQAAPNRERQRAGAQHTHLDLFQTALCEAQTPSRTERTTSSLARRRLSLNSETCWAPARSRSRFGANGPGSDVVDQYGRQATIASHSRFFPSQAANSGADASQRAIASLGAKQDGVLRHHGARRDGTVRDSVIFSILASEWPDVKRHLETRIARHGKPSPL